MSYQPLHIEEYALIGDLTSCALVGRNGSIDWLCWPRFDSAACFAALLGTGDNGRWLLAPGQGSFDHTTTAAGLMASSRNYRQDGLVLETVFDTEEGTVAVIDLMPINASAPSIIRIVEGRRGRVDMRMVLSLRFDYGNSIPWVTHLSDGEGITAIAGPSLVTLRSSVPVRGEGCSTTATFSIAEGERVSFVLSHGLSYMPAPAPLDAETEWHRTEAFWAEWRGKCRSDGPYGDAVCRSLLTLKALTYAPSGGIVAAATTSLPEQLDGSRNWDYRFCWLRDAALTLFALMHNGYYEEAMSWRDWLQRSVAGSPRQIQIMYGIGGERQLTEWEVPWLAGYQGAAPVRVGNGAAGQLQLDVYGEVISALHEARAAQLGDPAQGWTLEMDLLEHLEKIWCEPDEGMWEIRGARRQFTVSKVFCWMAFDRAIRDVETYGLPGPLKRWRKVRDDIHATVCREGFNPRLNSFTQCFNGEVLDAGLLLLPLVGFLSADDPRMIGTVAAVERDLLHDGFVLRYRTETDVDGLPGYEGAFLACTFWLVENYALQGRHEEAHALFEKLLDLRNDVGLLAEEYDPRTKRQVGNFPQAFSHVALIGAAMRLCSHDRATRGEPAKKQAPALAVPDLVE